MVLGNTLQSPLDCKEIQQVHPKENQSWIFIEKTDVEAETPASTLPPDAKNWLIGKAPDAEKNWRQEEKGMIKDEMVGWHHWLDGHEFEQAPGDGEGQGVLACCSLWGRIELNITEWLNWTELPLWANYLPKIPHLLVLSYWKLVFNIWILGRQKHSICSTNEH